MDSSYAVLACGAGSGVIHMSTTQAGFRARGSRDPGGQTRPCQPVRRQPCTSTPFGARRRDRRRRPAGLPHRRAHRPLAQRQVRRPGAVEQRPGLVGQGQQADAAGPLRRAPRDVVAHLNQQELFVQDLVRRRRPGLPPAGPVRPGAAPGRTCSSAICSSCRRRPTCAGFQPQFTVLDRALLQGRPGAARHPLRRRHRAQPRARAR